MKQYHVKLEIGGQPGPIEFYMQAENDYSSLMRVLKWAQEFFGEDAHCQGVKVRPLKGRALGDMLASAPKEVGQ